MRCATCAIAVAGCGDGSHSFTLSLATEGTGRGEVIVENDAEQLVHEVRAVDEGRMFRVRLLDERPRSLGIDVECDRDDL